MLEEQCRDSYFNFNLSSNALELFSKQGPNVGEMAAHLGPHPPTPSASKCLVLFHLFLWANPPFSRRQCHSQWSLWGGASPSHPDNGNLPRAFSISVLRCVLRASVPSRGTDQGAGRKDLAEPCVADARTRLRCLPMPKTREISYVLAH